MNEAPAPGSLVFEPAKALPPTGPLVDEVLANDSREVPGSLLEQSAVFIGDKDLDVARYISQEFHDLEMEHVWKRVWQMACRVEDIPEAGDHVLYDIGTEQLIVVRTSDGSIKAYPNSCLHRGTTLRTCGGNVNRFKCPFHGFIWSLEGDLIAKPAAWDFPHVDKQNFHLPEVRVDCWGGFVFICLDKDTPPLMEYVGRLPEFFQEWPFENRHKAVHVAKKIPCNWKAAMEAFLEGYHIPTTHPQSVGYSGEAQGQYDVWEDQDHVNRVIVWVGAADTRSGKTDENALADSIIKDMPVLGKPGDIKVPEGETARRVMAQRFRDVVTKSSGVDVDKASDAEMLDAIQYFLFPNLVPWSGVGAPIVYRFRPFQNDPNMCIMEIMYLYVCSPDRPRRKGAPIRWLSDDETFADVAELGGLGAVFDQDYENLERVQKGLHMTHKPGVTLANYQEIRIRHYHAIIDRYIAEGRARA
ncbi:(2Fe-2S)-binding protein [Novosphingobium indicum]|uniref:(2Fe-2S)-binding protein n=1 Tax=Novosphingobium indicum TaxID=462949 RepID=A0ABQ2K1Y0_9SPHN|nr:SRPBCC family protein [Novosphingobium indicum]GGN61674.1 (2Fe-2S)-binding protein [Novosphingobium indicum]